MNTDVAGVVVRVMEKITEITGCHKVKFVYLMILKL